MSTHKSTLDSLFEVLQSIRHEACRLYDAMIAKGLPPEQVGERLAPWMHEHQKMMDDCRKNITDQVLHAIREYEVLARTNREQAEYFMKKAYDNEVQARKLKEAVIDGMNDRCVNHIDCGNYSASIVDRVEGGETIEDLIIR